MINPISVIQWIGANWKLIAIGILLTVVVLFVHHYDSLKSERDQLKQANEAQQKVIEDAMAAIGDWKNFVSTTEAVLEGMKQNQLAVETEKRRINEIFAKHDIGELAKKKPGLVESRINLGSRDITRMLECKSGAVAKCGASSGEGKAP